MVIITPNTERVDYDFIDRVYKRHGLDVNKDKCKSTERGEIVDFLG